MIEGLKSAIDNIEPYSIYGTVKAVRGLLFEVEGLDHELALGNQCLVYPMGKSPIVAEVVGFNKEHALLMAYDSLTSVGPGCRVEKTKSSFLIQPDISWLGRVINGFAQPIDGRPNLLPGRELYPVNAAPLPAHLRQIVGERINLGIRVLNTFTTTCYGQRMGIFAASGVGKSVLMAQIARFTNAEVNVIGLIGERGREVQEFVEELLDEETRKRTVLIVATSDQPALMRRQAAYLTLTIAEYFRDQGKQVLCFIDSITRFAMALREISLSVGEPPATRGYTPSVFAELPRLLERAGPGRKGHSGGITGLFNVLVEGDDENEPISDAVRGILDGHIMLDRSIAHRNRFPAVNVLKSISRLMPDCNTEEETKLINKARNLLATYDDMAELIRLGAYRQGTDERIDEAIHYYEALENFIAQRKDESCSFEEGFTMLAEIFKDE